MNWLSNWVTPQDFAIIGFLIFLEGILSIDNALVLAMMAKPLPKAQQRKALTYGLIGAVVFRLMATLGATWLIKLNWVKFVGGGYLLFIALKHFYEQFKKRNQSEHEQNKPPVRSFWRTVIMIELVDIAFAVDSILAAVSLTNKVWIVFTGGFLGVVMMRFAAKIFISLFTRFANLETTAYLLVATIGIKVVIEGLHLPGVDFHSASAPSFWIFWATMLAFISFGLIPKRSKPNAV